MLENGNPFTVISRISKFSHPVIDKQKFDEDNIEIFECNVIYTQGKKEMHGHTVMFSTRGDQTAEPEFLNFKVAQESIPRNQFRHAV
jgi:hypothetical protein